MRLTANGLSSKLEKMMFSSQRRSGFFTMISTRSSILKLQTDQEALEGHDACSDYLVANLLFNPAVLDADAQALLQSEVVPGFTDEDNQILEKLPDKEDVKDVLFKSNLNAAPGTDGITSLLYKECWDTR